MEAETRRPTYHVRINRSFQYSFIRLLEKKLSQHFLIYAKYTWYFLTRK